MTIRSAIVLISLGCGVEETGLLLQPPGPIEKGDVIISLVDGDFGRAAVGGNYFRPILFTNPGRTRAIVQLMGIDGDAGAFRIDRLGAREQLILEPGEQSEANVLYQPGGGDERAAFLFNTCPNELCFVRLAVHGFGVLEAFRCAGSDLGTVAVGECLEREIVCMNDTDYEVTATSSRLTGSPFFSITSFPSPSPASPGAARTLGVAFCPSAAGSDRAVLNVEAQVSQGQNVTSFPITAEAIGTTNLVCEPTVLTIGPIPVDEAATAIVECKASRVLTIDQLAFRSGTPFGLSAQLVVNFQPIMLPYSVTNTDTIEAAITFAPTSAGEWREALLIHHEGQSERIDIVATALEDRGGSRGYTITQEPNTPLVPAGGTSLSFSDPDDGYVTLPIDFDFEFAGMPVTNVWVATNGFISFSGNYVTSLINGAIPESPEPNAFIAWWWDDLYVDNPLGPASTVTTTVAGVAPSRIRIFTFLGVSGFGDNTPIVSAEVRLFETTNEIEVHYGSITPGQYEFSASAGWESFDGSEGEDALGCSPLCATSSWPASTVLRYVPAP